MHPNALLIKNFYLALSKLDGAAMAACYAPDVVFSDPVFQDLRGDKAGKMWQMLCARGKDMTVVVNGIEANDSTGKAHWVATYTFSATGKKVVNDIHASFVFRQGKIIRHTDRFDLYKWMRQALGLKGTLLGWIPAVQGKLQNTARAGLDAFKA